MVEFIIVLPIMLLLVFMIAFAGIGFERYLRVSNAARVAARAAVVARFDSMEPCAAASAAADLAMDGLTTTKACGPAPPSESLGPGELVKVTLTYQLPNIPLISSITGPVEVTASATERLE
jgi:Flp pilus assembly protein TadG